MYKLGLVCQILLIWIFSACSNKALAPRDYISWVNNPKNGLKVNEDVGDFIFCLQFEPLPYVALREQYKGLTTQKEIDKMIDERKDFQYFTLAIESSDKKTDILKKDIGSKGDYYARIQYFSYMMQQDLSLVDGTETLPCMLFQFQRDYNMTPFQTFILGFPKSAKSQKIQDKVLVYQDKVLGLKKVEIKIAASDIEKLPKLKID